MWHAFVLAFIPLFVAIDVIGVVPIFLGLTDSMSRFEKARLVTSATLTALVIALVFMLIGRGLFRLLGITENDFRIGGGVLLLAISVRDLLYARTLPAGSDAREVGVVPLGIPLIMGPAALTTILILQETRGYVLTSLSLATNLAIVWLAFRFADRLQRVLGRSGTTAFARVMAIFMAAIAIMMIRIGLTNTLTPQ